MAQLVKTVQGLAIASVKTVQGTAIASVKTVQGVDNTASGGGPFVFIVSGSAGSSNSDSVTTSSADTTGAECIAISVSSYQPNAQPTVSDSKSNTWTAATEYTGVTLVRTRIYYCFNPTVGSGHTFTASGTASYPALAFAAFSGGSVQALDTQNGDTVSSGETLSTGNVTPSGNDMLVVTGINYNDSTYAEVSIDGPFTKTTGVAPGVGTNFGVALAYEIQTTATARNPQWTSTGNGNYMVASIAVLK
jgi:hypothetical protein